MVPKVSFLVPFGTSMKENFIEEKFNGKGAGFSSIIIRKNNEKKHEKVFSIESKE